MDKSEQVAAAIKISKRHLYAIEFSDRYDVALTKLSPVGIFRLDATGRCLYVNEQWCKLSGISLIEALGTGWRLAVHPDDLKLIDAKIKGILVDKKPFKLELRFQHPDGKITWVLSQALAETRDNGSIVSYMGTVVDISERKQAEQALHESEAEFRANFEQVAVGMAHVGLDGRWLRVNQKLCEIVGYSREEFLNLTFQDITHADDVEIALNYNRQLLAEQIPNYTMEKRYLRKDGSLVWINLTVSLFRNQEEQKPKYFIAVVEDISKRKQAEITLQQRAEELIRVNTILAQTTTMLQKRNQELDQFAYVASHDLKAPLRAIASLSEWLEEDLGDILPQENRHQMSLLRGRVRRMEGLINGLLEYSRVGRTEIPSSLVNVGALITEVIDSLQPPPTFNIAVDLAMPTIITQRLPLQQVFANLIGNAITHHPRVDGWVKISAQNQGNCYKFTVADDGTGIPLEYHDKIFVIFQTLQARDTKENTGIGLAIVKKIVESQGGKITLEPFSGPGSTFSFTWPKQRHE